MSSTIATAKFISAIGVTSSTSVGLSLYCYNNRIELFGIGNEQATPPKNEDDDKNLASFEYDYAIGKTHPNLNTSSPSNPTNKTYSCLLPSSSKTKEPFIDNGCEIYSLNKSTDNKNILDLTETLKSPKPLTLNNLDKTSPVIIKLNESILNKNNWSGTKDITIIDKSNSSKELGKVTINLPLNVKSSDSEKGVILSHLFVVKVTESKTPSPDLTSESTFTCITNDESKPDTCNIYKFPKELKSPYTYENLQEISKVTQNTDFTKSNYLVIELLNTGKKLSDLSDTKIIIKSGEQEIAYATFDNLLIGSASIDKEEHHLIQITDKEQVLTEYILTSGHKNIIIAKGETPNYYFEDQNPTLTANSFLCRVIKGNIKYEDVDCKVHSLSKSDGTPDKKSDSPSIYLPNDSIKTVTTNINKVKDLTDNTYHIVELSNALNQHLTSGSKVQLIDKTNKDKGFKNRYSSLTKISDITKDQETHETLKSNLVLVSLKDANGQNISTLEELTKCTITRGTTIDCKFYWLNASHKRNTQLKSDAFKDFIQVANTIPQINTGHLALIDFQDNRYAANELKDKNIEVTPASEKTNEKITFTFEDLAFGQVSQPTNKFVLPMEAKIVTAELT